MKDPDINRMMDAETALNVADEFKDCPRLAFSPSLTALLKLAAEVRSLRSINAELVEALHRISLASQNSMSSKTECGQIARTALARAKEKP